MTFSLVHSLVLFLAASSNVLAKSSTLSSSTPVSASSTLSSSTPVSVTSTASGSASSPPDVLLHVPQLSVGRIELDVEDLTANINLNAQVASLVTLNAGVAVSIKKVNLTIVDVEAQLDLVVRLGHLVDIVNRVFESLDLNPLLISTIGNVTSLLKPIVGVIDGLLGSITNGGTTLNFLIDNLGNIVQEVGGVSTIVGSYTQNMTAAGAVKQLSDGLVQKTFSYSPLNALVDIVFNAAGQVVQASVAKSSGSTTSSTAPASTSSAAAGKRR